MTKKEIENFLNRWEYVECYVSVYAFPEDSDTPLWIEVDRMDIETEISNFDDDYVFYARVEDDALYFGK